MKVCRKICVLWILMGFVALNASGSPVSTRLGKVYKELIIQGERPEISSCMALAFKSTRENGPYQTITYAPDVLDNALVNEEVESGRLVKVVTTIALGEPRKSGFYLSNPLEQIKIICTQVDEGTPTLQL